MTAAPRVNPVPYVGMGGVIASCDRFTPGPSPASTISDEYNIPLFQDRDNEIRKNGLNLLTKRRTTGGFNMRDNKPVLSHDTRDHRRSMEIEALKGFEVHLDSGTSGRIAASNRQLRSAAPRAFHQ